VCVCVCVFWTMVWVCTPHKTTATSALPARVCDMEALGDWSAKGTRGTVGAQGGKMCLVAAQGEGVRVGWVPGGCTRLGCTGRGHEPRGCSAPPRCTPTPLLREPEGCKREKASTEGCKGQSQHRGM